MKVKELIEALSQLPSDAPIKATTEYGRFDVEIKDDMFLVYEKDGVIELYIDDGQTYSGDLVQYRRSLFR